MAAKLYDDLVKKTICDRIDGLKDEIFALSNTIRENPELGHQEFIAHRTITSFLQDQGFKPTLNAYGLETSFEAESTSAATSTEGEGRIVTFCAEYDALPELGHACGHHLIALSSTAAFVGVSAALGVSGINGRVRLLGTPAEEAGAGKIRLIEKGAFLGVDAAMMCHPTRATTAGDGVSNPTCIASAGIKAVFLGKEAHAGSTPWDGVNALDAATLAYTAIGMLRQHIKPAERINAVIDETGDMATNVIPAKAGVRCGVRCETLEDVMKLLDRVEKCFEGAAIATGCEVECTRNSDVYGDLRPNSALCLEFTKAMAEIGSTYLCDLENPPPRESWGTDMGNVSHVVPSFHGSFYIPTSPGEFPHTTGFAKSSAAKEAFDVALDVGKGMALAAFNVLADDVLAGEIKKSFPDAANSKPKMAPISAP